MVGQSSIIHVIMQEICFTNVEKIVGEISQRYGNRLAGLWMDDGIGYYPNGASFEKIAKAAKKWK